MYEYNALVKKVVDGDTLDVAIDLGFSVNIEQRIRVNGIDAYEKYTLRGKECKLKLTELIQNKYVIVRSKKPGGGDKYGRYLADVIIPDVGILSDWLLEHGYGYIYTGNKKPDVSEIANSINPSGVK